MAAHNPSPQPASARRTVWLLLLAVCAVCAGRQAKAQTSIFGSYDFGGGGYVLLVYPTAWGNLDQAAPVSYIADIDRLNALKTLFRLRPTKPYTDHWTFPDVRLFLCRKGRIVESWAIATAPSLIQVGSTQATFRFDGYIPFEGYRLARRELEVFGDLSQARAAWEAEPTDSTLICLLPPPWKDKEGCFDIGYVDQPEEKEAFEARVQAMFAERFPDEPLYIEVTLRQADWIRGMDYDVAVHCRRAVYDAFADAGGAKSAWRPYTLRLESYWME